MRGEIGLPRTQTCFNVSHSGRDVHGACIGPTATPRAPSSCSATAPLACTKAGPLRNHPAVAYEMPAQGREACIAFMRNDGNYLLSRGHRRGSFQRKCTAGDSAGMASAGDEVEIISVRKWPVWLVHAMVCKCSMWLNDARGIMNTRKSTEAQPRVRDRIRAQAHPVRSDNLVMELSENNLVRHFGL